MTPAVRRGGSASHACPRGHRTDWVAAVHSDPWGRNDRPVAELDNSEGVYDSLGADA